MTAGIVLMLVGGATSVLLQTRTYPKEIRGYKVERTVVEVKKPEAKKPKPGKDNRSSSGNIGADPVAKPVNDEADVDQLIQFGKPELARATPLGITFEVPIVVSPVKQSGHVDFLVFEDMVINGTSINVNEYHQSFDLPNKQPLTLGEPLSIYIYLPNAMMAAVLGDWSDKRETWPVTGRVYVFGKFKKNLFTFKRVVPVELDLTMRNPLKER